MSTFMERIQGRIAQRDQGRRKATGKRTRQNIDHNRFDRQMWDEMRGQERIDRDIDDLLIGDDYKGGQRKGYDNAPELLQDLAYSLYKPVPRLNDKREVEKDARLNRELIEEIQSSPYYNELREHTVLDDTCTTIALNTIADAVRDIIVRNQEQVEQSNQDKAESTDEMNNEENRPQGVMPGGGGGQDGEDGEESEGEGQGQGQGQGDPSQDDPSQDDQDGQDGQDSSEGGEGQGQDPDLDQGDDGDQDLIDEKERDLDLDEPEDADAGDGPELELDEEFSRAINQAVREANDEVDELEGLRKGIGLEDGEWRQMSPEQRLAMAEKLKSPAMKELSEMIGRMKRFAMGQQAHRIADVPHEPVDVEQGNDLRRLLGSEYALLDDEDTEWEFYRRFVDGEMLQYKMQGTEDAGKGPLVACIDMSYSMAGRPFTWAMGVAEALRRISQEQERDYYAMLFGTNRQRHRFEFPKGTGPFEEVLRFLSSEARGGTEFDGVLNEALSRVVKQDEEGAEKADIVFITDGQAYLSEEWLKQFNDERERVGCRVFSVYIGGARDMWDTRHGGPTQLLDKFSDVVIPVSELRTDSVRDVFAQV